MFRCDGKFGFCGGGGWDLNGAPIDGAHPDLVHRVLLCGRRRLLRAPPVLEVSRRARWQLGLAAGVAIAAARSASH